METIAELKAELQSLIDLMLAKGKREPNADVNVYAQQETRMVYLVWKERNALTGSEYGTKLCWGDSLAEAFAEARRVIASWPSADEVQRHTFMTQLGRLIDAGREGGIEDDYLNPLTEAMKRLSENIITHQAEPV